MGVSFICAKRFFFTPTDSISLLLAPFSIPRKRKDSLKLFSTSASAEKLAWKSRTQNSHVFYCFSLYYSPHKYLWYYNKTAVSYDMLLWRNISTVKDSGISLKQCVVKSILIFVIYKQNIAEIIFWVAVFFIVCAITLKI